MTFDGDGLWSQASPGSDRSYRLIFLRDRPSVGSSVARMTVPVDASEDEVRSLAEALAEPINNLLLAADAWPELPRCRLRELPRYARTARGA